MSRVYRAWKGNKVTPGSADLKRQGKVVYTDPGYQPTLYATADEAKAAALAEGADRIVVYIWTPEEPREHLAQWVSWSPADLVVKP